MKILAIMLAVLLLLPLLLNAALYAQWWRYRFASSHTSRELLPALLARGFLLEWASAVVILLGLPIAAVWPHRATTSGRFVIILPELLLPPGSCWPLQRRLRALGWEAFVYRYPGCRFDLQTVAREIASLAAASANVMLIGYGLGGNIARRVLEHGPAPPVRRLITLGTPHQGSSSALARWALRTRLGSEAGAMAPPAGGDNQLSDRLDVIAIHSALDAWVLPPTTAEYRGAFNIEVRGIGHLGLLTSRRVFTLVRENLEA